MEALHYAESLVRTAASLAAHIDDQEWARWIHNEELELASKAEALALAGEVNWGRLIDPQILANMAVAGATASQLLAVMDDGEHARRREENAAANLASRRHMEQDGDVFGWVLDQS